MKLSLLLLRRLRSCRAASARKSSPVRIVSCALFSCCLSAKLPQDVRLLRGGAHDLPSRTQINMHTSEQNETLISQSPGMCMRTCHVSQHRLEPDPFPSTRLHCRSKRGLDDHIGALASLLGPLHSQQLALRACASWVVLYDTSVAESTKPPLTCRQALSVA